MFGWRTPPETVDVGDVFRRIRPSKTAEIAEIVSIWPDRTGIPHVRFRLQIVRQGRALPETDERTLSLAAFRQLFPERMSA